MQDASRLLHVSVVHELPSSQSGGVPATTPPVRGLHVSTPLQYRPSL